MSSDKEAPHLHITARAPFHVYYEGEARSLTAKNPVGTFDVLPGHADFFSVLSPCDVQIDTGSDTITFSITDGIVSVQNDELMLFVNM